MEFPPGAIHREEMIVPQTAIDRNGHVNNVEFIQWMQDIAVRHFRAIIGFEALKAVGAIWVVRSHHVEYLSPTFEGERIQLVTWVVSCGRVRSLRRYKFVRSSDNKVLVRGETDWVFVNATTGRPMSIPAEIQRAFILVPDDADLV
jgi:acyl-CoA thioester hydrolase